MADGDVINKHMKDFLKDSPATNKASRKKASDIATAVLESVGTPANKSRVKLAVFSLLETYTEMVALGKRSAIQTADDVNGFWLDLANINANADTNFSCGLSDSSSVAATAATAAIAAAPASSARSRSSRSDGKLGTTRSAKSDCCELLVAAIKLHDAHVINDSAFIDMVKNIAQEQAPPRQDA